MFFVNSYVCHSTNFEKRKIKNMRVPVLKRRLINRLLVSGQISQSNAPINVKPQGGGGGGGGGLPTGN